MISGDIGWICRYISSLLSAHSYVQGVKFQPCEPYDYWSQHTIEDVIVVRLSINMWDVVRVSDVIAQRTWA
ncbi:hypothetical protein PMIN04_006013 [Paraphaeosphaeria minitans]